MNDTTKLSVSIVGEPDILDCFTEILPEKYVVQFDDQSGAAVEDLVDAVVRGKAASDTSYDGVIENLDEHEFEAILVLLTEANQTAESPIRGRDLAPVSPRTYWEQMARVVRQQSYHRLVEELFAVTRERATLACRSNEDTTTSGRYCALVEKEEWLEEQLDHLMAQFDHRAYDYAFMLADGCVQQ